MPIDNECGISATDTIEQLLSSAFSGVYYLPCRNYNSTNQECTKLLPKIGTKPHSRFSFLVDQEQLSKALIRETNTDIQPNHQTATHSDGRNISALSKIISGFANVPAQL